jgi:putative transposase
MTQRAKSRQVPEMVVTFRYRLKDKHAAELNRMARQVNVVWNYCNEMQQRLATNGKPRVTRRNLRLATNGASKILGIHSSAICQVCIKFERALQRGNKGWLQYRGAKALGWIPFNQHVVRVLGHGKLRFRGKVYETQHWRDIPEGAMIRAGSFNQDARGRWYINCPIRVPLRQPAPVGAVGIDLGLSTLAALSTGEHVSVHQSYRKLEERLGAAHRAKKRRLYRKLHTKVTNQRRDHLHKATARIALSHNLIFVGDVSSEKLAQTHLAKSVYEAGWGIFRSMLSYKAIRHGGRIVGVGERNTSQTCSTCGALPEGRPLGIAGLRIREWKCGGCGATHDRDVNAALNILRIGLDTLAEGIAR